MAQFGHFYPLIRLSRALLWAALLLTSIASSSCKLRQNSQLSEGDDAKQELMSYSSRPTIESLEAEKHKPYGQTSRWFRAREAIANFVALNIALYPKDQIYFLARDGEYFYDAARIVFADRAEILDRIHLLNVSRKNIRSDRLVAYLEQEGISEKGLAGGRAILVDTALAGTLYNELRSNPELASIKHQLVGQMAASTNKNIPSARSVIAEFTKTHEGNPADNWDYMKEFEDYPHVTSRSHEYKLIDGRLEPISEPFPNYRRHFPESALALMKDIKYFFSLPALKQNFDTRLNAMIVLREAALDPDFDSAKVLAAREALNKAVANEYDLGSAIVLDIRDALMKGTIVGDPDANPRFWDETGVKRPEPFEGLSGSEVADFEKMSRKAKWTLNAPNNYILRLSEKQDLAVIRELLESGDHTFVKKFISSFITIDKLRGDNNFAKIFLQETAIKSTLADWVMDNRIYELPEANEWLRTAFDTYDGVKLFSELRQQASRKKLNVAIQMQIKEAWEGRRAKQPSVTIRENTGVESEADLMLRSCGGLVESASAAGI